MSIKLVKSQLPKLLKARKFSVASSDINRANSNFVRIVEVGARDGLQNEPAIVDTDVKINFINKLSDTGLKNIEVTSFVSPKWVPQMADNTKVFNAIKKKPNVSYSVLVPNLQGLQSAIKAGAKEIAIFGSASETFSQKNVNCSVRESIERFTKIIEQALEHDMKIRGYISCVVGCPYEGETNPKNVAALASVMLDHGCYEISLGDTIGVGRPKKIRRLLNEIKHVRGDDLGSFAMHCHDTYGQAVANVYEALENGIRVFDSSVAGLGGCPYAAGASGNVSTEDLLYFLEGQGLETGVDFEKIVEIGDYICKEIGRQNQSKTGVAMIARKRSMACSKKEASN